MGRCFGEDFTPIYYRKMPIRLAKRLSAGFQDKESKPQVSRFSVLKRKVPLVIVGVGMAG